MNKNKKGKSQVIMKTDTTENWAKCEDKYIPALNTIIVYQDENQTPRLKISDGATLLKDLVFINLNNTNGNIKESNPEVNGTILSL